VNNILTVAFVAKAININWNYVPYFTICSALFLSKEKIVSPPPPGICFVLVGQPSMNNSEVVFHILLFVYRTNTFATSAFVLKYTELHVFSQNTICSCL